MTAYGEADQIRVPMPDGTYRDYAVLALLGKQYGQLQGTQGFGMPPIRIIEQRGPLQHGATTLDYRYLTRVLQVVVSKRLACGLDMVERRWELIDLLRPSRSFLPGVCPAPLIYRKWLPGGKVIRGIDLELTNGSATVLSLTGRFVHYGLRVGSRFTISGSTGDDGVYTLVGVNHDGSIELSAPMTATEGGVHFTFTSEPTYRDLYCVLEMGPQWDQSGTEDLNGYVEAIRLVASDPFWYGPEQQQAWSIAPVFEDLIFDQGYVPAGDEGAWFGLTPGTGRWLFANSYLSATIEIPYWGHHTAEPVIQIIGPAQDLTMRNNDTDAQITFNYTVGPGRTVLLDTLNLTAYDDLGNDLFLYLTGDLSGFIITPDANNDRVNELEVSFGGATNQSQVLLAWRNRYASI